MSDNISYENLRELFNEYKCALVSKEQLDLKLLHYVCSCGREDYISLDKFRESGHCGSCSGWCRRNGLTFAFVKQQFEIYGNELLSKEYIEAKSDLEYRCACGRVATISYNGFIGSITKKCIKCQNDIGHAKRRISMDTVKKTYTDAGCTLTTTTYTGTHQKLSFICSCGRTHQKTYTNFRKAPFCNKCGRKQSADNHRYSYEYVNAYFKEHGCKLKSETYISSTIKLEYICVCGSTSWIGFMQFKNGHRCGCIKSKGEKILKDALEKLGFKLDPQHKYDDCRYMNVLRFDFYVTTNDNISFLIEFDGIQHFKPVIRFGGEQRFRNQIKIDNIKNRYSINNRIPIIRISYKELMQLDMIIDMYVTMLRENAAPPIVFTNRKLYEPMYNAIKSTLGVTRIPKVLLASNELPDKTKAEQTSSNHYFISLK